MLRVAHIVNPLVPPEGSDLHLAQPVTFETMRVARSFAAGRVDVALFSAQYPEDRSAVPDDFTITPDLDRSVLDLASFEVPRKLPPLRDILDRLYEATDADFLVYTNVDIALMPHFYPTVESIIAEGYDAFTINRRTIGTRQLEQLPLMYADLGKSHPGNDCFVFARSLYPRFHLADVCVGSDYVGSVLRTNLECWASRFKLFDDLHLTFHLGDAMGWLRRELRDYCEFNRRERLKVFRFLVEAGRLAEATLLRAEARN